MCYLEQSKGKWLMFVIGSIINSIMMPLWLTSIEELKLWNIGLENHGWVRIHNIKMALAFFYCNNKSHTKMSCIYQNLIRLCTTSNNENTHDKPSKTFTSTKCFKLTTILTFIGVSNLVFNINVWNSSITCFVGTNILIHLLHTFLQMFFSFVPINFTSFWNLN
jgi:hypothetical protein